MLSTPWKTQTHIVNFPVLDQWEHSMGSCDRSSVRGSFVVHRLIVTSQRKNHVMYTTACTNITKRFTSNIQSLLSKQKKSQTGVRLFFYIQEISIKLINKHTNKVPQLFEFFNASLNASFAFHTDTISLTWNLDLILYLIPIFSNRHFHNFHVELWP